MITVYEIKSNGFFGISKEIDPREGVGTGWTYTAPPGEGSYKWENSQWVEAVEPDLSIPGPDFEFCAEQIRAERNKRMLECDWTQSPDSPVDKEAWAEYRQALRDVPEQDNFPLSVDWPSPPT